MEPFVLPLVYVMAFIAVVLVVQTAGGLLYASQEGRRRVNRRLTLLDSGMAPESVYARLVRQPGEHPGRHGLRQIEARVGVYLRQASLEISARRFLVFVLAAAAAAWIFSLVVLRAPGQSVWINSLTSLVAALALAGAGAWVLVNRRRQKRFKLLEDQLPLALDIMNRSLRAGHPVLSAVRLAAQEMGDPLGSEFGLIVDETTYGVEFSDALRNFARRTGSNDAAFFAVSVTIQSQTGGNLAEVLEGLAGVVRGRNMLGKRVRALSSEGRASAMLLSALPFFMIGAMFLMQPGFYTTKFSDPIFWPVVIIALIDYVIGVFMIHRIINFKY